MNFTALHGPKRDFIGTGFDGRGERISREYKRFWASESLCCWVGSMDEGGLERSALSLLLPLLLIAVEDHGNRFISDVNAIKRVNTCME